MNFLPAIQKNPYQCILVGPSYKFNDFLMGDRVFHFSSGNQVIGRFIFSQREEHESKRKFLDELWRRLFFLKNIPDLNCRLTFENEKPYQQRTIEERKKRMLSKAYNTLQNNISIIEKSGSLFIDDDKKKEMQQYHETIVKINQRYAS